MATYTEQLQKLWTLYEDDGQPMPSAADIDARFERLRNSPNLSQFAFESGLTPYTP